jgi:hypothetical protein
MVLAAVFAVICLGVAIKGFTSLGDIADPAQAADARGFAWFWTFLAGVAIVCGLLSWWLTRTQGEDEGT